MQLLAGFTVVAVIALPIGIWQVLVIGHLEAQDVFDFVVIPIHILIFIARKKIPLPILSAYLTLIAISLTLVGTYFYGLVSTGFLWFFISSFVVGLLYRPRLAAAYCLIYLIFSIFVSIGFISGKLQLDLDANELIILPALWAVKITVAVVGAGIMIHAIRTLQDNLRLQVQQINKQNELIERLANYDLLTGLPTLRLADERFEMALTLAKRNKLRSCILFLDLDGFKNINDTYGHDAGDMILKSVAARIVSELRESDTACRIGGDEFLIVLSEIENSRSVGEVCHRIMSGIGEDFSFEGATLNVGVSVGGAIYPDHGDTAQSLRRAADEAMYEVKRTGKNNFLIQP